MYSYNIYSVNEIGFRCNSRDFLRAYPILEGVSSPLGSLYCDIESAFLLIGDEFNDFLHDIVKFNTDQKTVELLYKKNTVEVDKRLLALAESQRGYITPSNGFPVYINQNYLDVNESILPVLCFKWKRICG